MGLASFDLACLYLEVDLDDAGALQELAMPNCWLSLAWLFEYMTDRRFYFSNTRRLLGSNCGEPVLGIEVFFSAQILDNNGQ